MSLACSATNALFSRTPIVYKRTHFPECSPWELPIASPRLRPTDAISFTQKFPWILLRGYRSRFSTEICSGSLNRAKYVWISRNSRKYGGQSRYKAPLDQESRRERILEGYVHIKNLYSKLIFHLSIFCEALVYLLCFYLLLFQFGFQGCKVMENGYFFSYGKDMLLFIIREALLIYIQWGRRHRDRMNSVSG